VVPAPVIGPVMATALALSLAGVAAPAQERAATPSAVAKAVSTTTTAETVSGPKPLRATDAAALERRWGIHIESLRLTAAGYMLDFRYRVVDAAKAAPLFDRRTKPLLRDEASGAVVAVPTPPKTGALRSSNDPKEGRTYFMFFANPGRFIKKHRDVTVTIGEFSVSGLVVR
jgi:hypothetical protein